MTRAEQLVEELHEELKRLDEIELPNISTKDFDKGETERAMRQAQIAELDAVNTYQQAAQSTHDPKIRDLLNDVADEEKVHQGEFAAATDKEDPKNKTEIEDGEKEAKEKSLGETLRRFHSEFPELVEAGVLPAVAKSLGNSWVQGMRNAPIIGKGVTGFTNALGYGQQPAGALPAAQSTPAAQQPVATSPQQGKGLLYGVGSAIGGAIKAGVQAHQANKASPQEDAGTAPNAPASSGLEAFEADIEEAYKAIVAFAQNSSLASKAQAQQTPAPTAATQKKAEKVIRSYDQLLQELTTLHEDDTQQGNLAGRQRDTQAPQSSQPASPPANTQDQDVQRLNTIANNFFKKAPNFDALKGNDNLMNFLVKFVQEAQTKGVTIQGLDKIDPKNLQAAIDQEKQAGGNAEQQIVNMPDDQLATAIGNMDRRTLASVVKKAVQEDPGIAQQLVKYLPQQSGAPPQPANPSNTTQQ